MEYLPIVYFSSVSLFTHKFLDTVLALDDIDTYRIPIQGSSDFDIEHIGPVVLVIPSYLGAQSAPDLRHVPVQVMKWMKSIGPKGRANISGVVGIGNTNFGIDFCASAREISAKMNIPLLGRYELSGLPGDHEQFLDYHRRFSRMVTEQ